MTVESKKYLKSVRKKDAHGNYTITLNEAKIYANLREQEYHKAKVESITDQKIGEQSNYYLFGKEKKDRQYDDDFYFGFIQGCKWLKQKLLSDD